MTKKKSAKNTVRGLYAVIITVLLAVLCAPAGCANPSAIPPVADTDKREGTFSATPANPDEPGAPADSGAPEDVSSASGIPHPGTTDASGGDTGAGAPPYTAKPVVSIAVPDEPVSLDPHYAGDDDARAIICNIYEPLFLLDDDSLEPVPCLAAEYRLLDDLRWEITLRDGVYFQDGSAFTVNDAVFSVNRAIDPILNIQPFYDLASILRAEKTGDKTMVVTTRYPDPALPRRLTRLDMVSKTYTESKTPGQLTKVANGTGPYMLDHWSAGNEIVLVRFRGYWGDPPAQDVAVYHFIGESADRMAALLAGEADIAATINPRDAYSAPQVLSAAGAGVFWVRFNQKSGIMADQAIRLAANHAVDGERLALDLFNDYAMPAGGQIGAPGSFGYSALVTQFPYDTVKAGELLEEAGYGGEPIQFVALAGGLRGEDGLAEAITGQLDEAGFSIELIFAGREEWLDALFDPKKAPDMLLSYTANDLFDMDGVYSTLAHKDGFQSAVDNSELNGLIEAARSEMDDGKRAGLYDEIALKLYDDPFAVYLPALKDIYGAAADLEWAPRRDGRILVAEMKFSAASVE